jgi:hypothetical protein
VICRPLVFIAATVLVSTTVVMAGQDAKSTALARELSQVLEAAKLDSIAVADPAVPGGFIAAIYIPGTQLLVVAAQYSAPTLLVDKINAGDFRGVYMDLHASATSGTKVFVQDIGPDGLISRSDSGDSWEEKGKTTVFDGQWKKAKETEADYIRTLTDADARYATMLSLLVAQAKQPKGKIGS